MVLVIMDCPKEMTIFVICTTNDVCDQKCLDKLCEHHHSQHPEPTDRNKRKPK